MTSRINKNIIFVDNSTSDFTGLDLNTPKVRGTESSIILLSESFAKLGCNVHVLTNTLKKIEHNKVIYLNKKNLRNENYDLCIAISDANYFYGIKSKKYVLWSNSLQAIEKFIRKKQVIPFIKFKPIVMTMCSYQYNKRSFLTSFYGKLMIPLTVDPIFFNEPINKKYIPKPIALNNVRSNRNLDLLIKIWKKYISKSNNNNNNILLINPNIVKDEPNHKKYNIRLRKYVTRSELVDELKETRVFVYIGHKSDVWTLTAEEAVQMCVPVVTFGIGSVSDRVIHGKNGFIAKTNNEFAVYLNKILNDDIFYLELKNKMYTDRGQTTWDTIALEWNSKLLINV